MADGLGIAKVLYVPAILAHARIDAHTKKQAPFVLSALSVKKMKMTGQLVYHYASVGRMLTKETITHVILIDYSDHYKSVKLLKKDQDIKLMKVRKDTVLL